MPNLTRQDFVEMFKEATIAGGIVATTMTALGNPKLILPATLFTVGGSLTTSGRLLLKEKQRSKIPENPTPFLS
jgi:hypothetical protein